MAKVFLDTNIFIDVAQRDPAIRESLDCLEINVSTLSIHIFCYTSKIRLPNELLEKYLDEYKITNLTKQILRKSLKGPTSDLEDNIQLHSAVEADCDYFLTNDRKLLNMSFFGKTQIIDNLPS